MTTDPVLDGNALPICEVCGKPFSSKRGLAAHMKVHDDPVVCPYCGDLVKYLAPHIRTKHPVDDRHTPVLEGVQLLIEENRALRARNAVLEQWVHEHRGDSAHSVDSPIPPTLTGGGE